MHAVYALMVGDGDGGPVVGSEWDFYFRLVCATRGADPGWSMRAAMLCCGAALAAVECLRPGRESDPNR